MICRWVSDKPEMGRIWVTDKSHIGYTFEYNIIFLLPEHVLETWSHKRCSSTTNLVFMKLGEVKLDKQCYILPPESFP